MSARVHELLLRSTARWPSRPLVIERSGTRTYAEVTAAAHHVAAELLGFGLEPGDRVALLAKSSSFYVEAYFGILAAGGTAVPLNTAIDPATLAYFLRDCGARVLMVGPKMERLVAKAADRLGEVELVAAPHAEKLKHGVASWTYSRGEGDPCAVEVDPAAPASIVYTSGSTGVPRGAVLSHAAICANVASILDYLELTEEDRALLVLPLYYVYGKSVLNTHVAVGGSVVVEDRFQYPKLALDTLDAERCTGLSGVPSTFNILLERTDFAEREMASLRYVTQAGGAMSPAVTRRLMAAIPDRRIFIMYGATEASARLACLPPEELSQAVGSIGRPIRDVVLTTRRADGSPCDVDEVGELVAQGPNLMLGYWNSPVETAAVLDEQGYHTGDLARRDAAGRFWIEGRIKDMIKVGGHRVGAQEVEHAIMGTERVVDVAVIGREDPILGEKLVAYVVLRPGDSLDEKAMGADLSERLAPYKIPGVWEVRDALPKNESGKIMKQVLRSEQ